MRHETTRDQCPECGRTVPIRLDGYTTKHKDKTGQRCVGGWRLS